MTENVSEAEILAVIDEFEPAQASVLRRVRQDLLSLLPEATEDLSWGMPTIRTQGIIVVSFLGFEKHNSFFPGPAVVAALAAKHPELETTKGTVHFDRVKAPSKSFVRELVTERIRAINAEYPKKSGESLELYDNGRVKARGKVRDGHMHGKWQFFRKDGTLMRAGSFTDGEQSGEWVTFNAQGEPHKTTRMGSGR